MSFLLTCVATLAVLAVLVPSVILFIEILLGRRSAVVSSTLAGHQDVRAVVLIPAHNEEAGIGNTVRRLLPELGAGDRILVIADNCSDRTAALALEAGANVIERFDTANLGKGFALAHGIESIASTPPDVVVVIDADCTVAQGSIAAIKRQTAMLSRPVQMLNLMRAPEGHERRFAVAEFAWRVKNQIRPTGLAQLGLPCQLMGTGMAFPWDIARAARFASANIVEDLELGMRLAGEGKAPVFFSGATVYSTFPVSVEGEIHQRRRWEGGSFSMLMKHGWANVAKGVARGNVALLALGLDMLVPPLVLHAGILLAVFTVTLVLWLLSVVPFLVLFLACAALVLFGSGILLAWYSRGRDLLPVSDLPRLFDFVRAKLRIHGRGAKPSSWIRADRSKD
jgi:cellulose synthase/poly-beta-1,6-N-acetylglucosamine synthase-like glycosyltransferase